MNKKTKDGIITASIVVAAAYLLYKIFSKKSLPNPNGGGNGGIVVQDPKSGGTLGTAPTMNQAKFKEIADKIFVSMSGFGTDEKEIYNQFALLKNNDDVMSLVAAYGIRQIPSGIWGKSAFEGNLPEAIGNELEQNEISEINSILVKNFVTIRFNSDGKLTTI